MLTEGLVKEIHQRPICVLLGLAVVGFNAAAGSFTTTSRQQLGTAIVVGAQGLYAHLRTPENALLFRFYEVALLIVLFLACAVGLAAQVQKLLGTAAEAQTRAEQAHKRAEEIDMHAATLERVRSEELVSRVLQKEADVTTLRRPGRVHARLRPMPIPEA